jgi:TadE-like protein
MKTQVVRSERSSRGQSLVETALMLPLLIMLVLNVINLGYFFLVVVNLTGAARTSVLYAIEGAATPAASPIPSSGGSTSPGTNIGSVTYLVYQDLTGALWNPTGVSVQVCTQANGTNTTTGSTQRANCQVCTSSGCGASGIGSPVPNADPEAISPSCTSATSPACSNFLLHHVAITYSFNALIPGRLFNIPMQAFSGICNSSGSCTFTRSAEMRSMN